MFDLTAFIRQLLPGNRKTPLNVAFVRMLFVPMQTLLLAIETGRTKLLYQARATGQVIVLEALLNQAVFGSDVGSVYILDANSAAFDFQVVIPSGLSATLTSTLIGILDAHKQVGKRYRLLPDATYTVPDENAGVLAWEAGYPYLGATKLVFAIKKTGLQRVILKQNGAVVYDEGLSLVAGQAYELDAPLSNVAYTIEIGNLSTSLTRATATGVIGAITYQRSGSSLSILVQVDVGDVQVKLSGRGGTTYTDDFADAIVFDSTVNGILYTRKRTFTSVPDGDYTAQVRAKGATIATSIDFTLSTSNQPPIVVNPMPDQVGKVGQPFVYSIPGNVFSDPDGFIANYLTTGLPAGLSHSPGNPIAGTPTTEGTYTVRVTVTDNRGATIYDEFNLVIAPADAPDPGSGGGGVPDGSTMIVKYNPTVLNLVAQSNGSKWRVVDTANHPVDGNRQGFWFVSGQPAVSSLSTEYQYEEGDEIIVYYVIATSGSVSSSNWDTKGWSKVVFGTP
ncbi:Ig domain-containing protein [Spirosoma areae]